MEQLLNVCWLLLSAMLVGLTVGAHRRGQLRCSLALALGCILLLSLLLFPALSLTDDLQRSRLDVEQSGRHPGTTLLLSTLDDVQLYAASIGAVMALLLLSLAGRRCAGIFVQWLDNKRQSPYDGSRPNAVRPPPAAALLPFGLYA